MKLKDSGNKRRRTGEGGGSEDREDAKACLALMDRRMSCWHCATFALALSSSAVGFTFSRLRSSRRPGPLGDGRRGVGVHREGRKRRKSRGGVGGKGGGSRQNLMEGKEGGEKLSAGKEASRRQGESRPCPAPSVCCIGLQQRVLHSDLL